METVLFVFVYTVSIRKGCFSSLSKLVLAYQSKSTGCVSLSLLPALIAHFVGIASLMKALRLCSGVKAQSVGSSDEISLLRLKINYFMIFFIFFFKKDFYHLSTKCVFIQNQQAAVDMGIH